MASGSSDNRVNSLIWGVVLALAGIGLLLFNLDLFVRYEPYVQYVASALLGLLALGFIGSYVTARFSPAARRGAGTSGGLDHWWRLIPAWTLFALAVMVFLTTLPALDQRVTAGVLFVGQAIAFAHIYLLDRAGRWWAIIPGGFMLMLGGTIALSSLNEDPEVLGTALFIGLGAVFFLLYLLGQRRQLWWALIPGSVLVLFWPISLFRQQRGTASDSALVAAAAAAAGRVADLACNAPPPPTASCPPTALPVNQARAASRPRATRARAGWANTAGLPPAPRWRCCPTRRKHSEKQFGDGRLYGLLAPY